MARVINLGADKETVEATLTDIKDISEPHPYFEGAELKYELMFELIVGDNKKIITEKTLPTLRARDWTSRFYDKNGYPVYTRFQTLNAFIKTLSAKVGEDILDGKKSFDIDRLIGQKIDVVFVSTDEHEFIDWVQTFRAAGVEVPSYKPVPEVKAANTNEDEEDDGLPF